MLRRLAAAASALVLAVGLAACGGGDDGSETTTSTSGATDAFPVSVTHKYGTTEITKEPKRIVVVGLVEQDALLSLGVVPVATTEWFGGHPGAIWPWAKDELGDKTVPTVLTNTDGLQLEKIAAQKPDLILGIYSGLTKEEYDKLSKFAPTIAQPKGGIDYGVSWQELTTMVGTAVGRKAQAEKVIADVEGTIAKAKSAHPEFAGKTGLMATNWEGYYVYGTKDPRGRFLTDLGFTLPAGLDAVTGKEFGASISRERTDLLGVDALVWLVPDPAADAKKIQSDSLYAKLGLTKEGRDLYLKEDESLGGATSFISVLSLPYLIDELVPKLAAAADGDPATTA
ncbi:iron-siderophore ABC transporter substrate-binding protein [Cryptosporangium aurantiacum]|uniref:Iron complex transport system substrate-binding protein n=1 Tax=Cryptosporangium aurantiacum TaxID=134849 RepID=A0A1M7KCZ5_9ACTN|nr:iron-siderophore ABC transporter substrate-binding protein [Cryptosporangium aurantiacum]SHM63114.1 iron complex transport system substrate-binding protein [Cryptosporangium aurantiacum]